MPAARFWRVVGVSTLQAGAGLALAELHLYDAGGRVDMAASFTSTLAPASGVVANLQDVDTATGVTFSAAQVGAPGFAFAWDFGAGVSKDIRQLRATPLGTKASFIGGYTLMCSSDGELWQWVYSGAFAWAGTATASTALIGAVWDTAQPDPFAAANSMVWHFESMSGGLSPDSSPAGNPAYMLGSVSISSAQARSGTSSAYFGSSASWISGGSTAQVINVGFQRGPFTFEISVQAGDTGASRVIAANRSDSEWGWRIYGSSAGEVVYENFGPWGTIQLKSPPGTLAYGVWVDIAIERCFGFVFLWINQALVDYKEDATNMDLQRELILGWQHTGVGFSPWLGYMDRMRACKVPRYAGGYLVSAARRALAPAMLLPLYQQDIGPLQVRELDGLTHLVDTEFGGRMTLAGTTKFKGVSTNYPIYARVNVLSERDKRLVAQVWSDPTTGAWSVPWLDEHQQFLALAQDPTGNYRAVAADRLVPEAAA